MRRAQGSNLLVLADIGFQDQRITVLPALHFLIINLHKYFLFQSMVFPAKRDRTLLDNTITLDHPACRQVGMQPFPVYDMYYNLPCQRKCPDILTTQLAQYLSAGCYGCTSSPDIINH